MTALTEWENFYIIVGSSAGALIGLQFIVVTLIAERPALGLKQAGAAFATPMIVHFGIVLLLSAIASAPWHGFGIVSNVWGLVGFGGILYVSIVARKMKLQTVYRPVFEDLLFHVLIPFAAYTMLTGSAFVSQSHTRLALFTVAAAMLLLLLVGIHNTWDAVTYQVFVRGQEQLSEER